MARLELIPLESRCAWNEALNGLPHGFHHTHDFAYAMHLTTGYHTFLVRICDSEARMVCPIVERRFSGHVDIATPSGLSGLTGVGKWSRCSHAWREFVRDRGYVCGYIGLHPLFEPRDFDLPAHRHNSIYVLRVDLGVEELIRRMDRNRRRQLRGWGDRARDLVVDRNAISGFLAANYGPFMRAAGARGPHLTSRALDFLCRCEACIVVGTAPTGALEGALVLGATRYAGDCLVNITTRAGRRHNTDLIWYGVNALIRRKVPALNLGGGTHEGDNVARAKKRFGPSSLALRALREVYRPDVYTKLCALAGVDASAQSKYFPAYRVRHGSPVAETAS